MDNQISIVIGWISFLMSMLFYGTENGIVGTISIAICIAFLGMSFYLNDEKTTVFTKGAQRILAAIFLFVIFLVIVFIIGTWGEPIGGGVGPY